MAQGKMNGGISPFALIMIAVVVIIIALGVYLWMSVSKFVGPANQPGFRVLGANQVGSLAQVMQNVTGGFSANKFEVSYSGNATVSIYGLKITLPLNISVARYYNDSRASVMARGVPLLGNVSFVQIKNGSRYYSCSGGLNSSRPGYRCEAEPESNTVFQAFNLSTGSPMYGALGNVTVHYGTVNQSSYQGTQCTNMDGYLSYDNSTELNSLNISSKIGQHVNSANMTFLSCVSADRIPLTMYAYVIASNRSTSMSAALQLGVTSFRKSSSPAIAVLPGPLVNSTG